MLKSLVLDPTRASRLERRILDGLYSARGAVSFSALCAPCFFILVASSFAKVSV